MMEDICHPKTAGRVQRNFCDEGHRPQDGERVSEVRQGGDRSLEGNDRIKRIFHPYQKWEDYLNGMYNHIINNSASNLIEQAYNLLINPQKLYESMINVSTIWKYSAEVNLSNYNCNRQAWLGQAACCYTFGVPESLTKEAWHKLTQNQQDIANNIADRVIMEWETNYRKSYRIEYAQKRFEY